VPKPAQTYEPEVPVKMREWIGPALATPGFVLDARRAALDIALPTLCVACREPVDGEGVCANCWSKPSFIAKPFYPKLGIRFVYADDGGDRQFAGLRPRRRAL